MRQISKTELSGERAPMLMGTRGFPGRTGPAEQKQRVLNECHWNCASKGVGTNAPHQQTPKALKLRATLAYQGC